jgi:hypothetical protein
VRLLNEMNASKTTLLGFLLLAVATPSIAAAQTGDFVHSANGPGSSRTTVNLGVRTYAPSLAEVNVVLPTVDFNLVHGINRTLDYEFRVSTIGLLSLIETGVKFRIVGDQAIALGGRLDATGLLLVVPEDDQTTVAGLFGVTPGVMLSTGGPRVQFSAGLDVPIVLGSADVGGIHATGPDAPFGYLLRPWLGVEFPISDRANLSLQAQAYVSTIGGAAVAPNLAAGISW